ncbi:MAG: hypothetical protein IIB38_16780 [Candidatus Hydrogenedentes bacterium]|nr:hypothetical protein [Candidatus Hydrogenedentota bacterium]
MERSRPEAGESPSASDGTERVYESLENLSPELPPVWRSCAAGRIKCGFAYLLS